MKIKSIKSLWGMEGSLESQLERIVAAGYDGIESPLPNQLEIIGGIPVEEKHFLSLLQRYKLDYIAMVFTSGNHVESFREQVQRATTFSPIMINSHSARDGMSYEDQLAFFERTQAIEQTLGIPVGHETHRGRAMFTPWTTTALLREFPQLKLTSDFSHWVCICESLLEDQVEHLEMAFQRTIHIHARVGYDQGPQVPHPAALEYALELSTHEEWWKHIVQIHKDAGTQLTFTPEFGPPPYMPRLPFTNQPVTNLWEVCLWMKHRFEEMVS
jgi:sugar phosphate isomerase/epimerase